MSVRLAMWSGPRNISTAMMRAWENRSDTAVWDEPLYAHYLQTTGLEHPMGDKIMAAGLTDWRDVAARATGPAPGGAQVFYQKHMTHHLLPDIEREWFQELTHVLLLRDPREVLLSYRRAMEAVTLEGIGFPQQAELFDWLTEHQGRPPLVIDSGDFLRQPERFLRKLCAHIGVPFEAGMLNWPAGPRDSDGVWAPHWYASVEASTGFAPWRPREGELSGTLREIEVAARVHYDRMHEQRWRPDESESPSD